MAFRNVFRKRNNEKGAVTIEAAIGLTTFLFLFLMVYSLITICRAQAKIQVAINATAKEISQYSYVFALTGLNESLGGFQDEAQKTEDQINKTAKDVATVFEGVQSIGDDAIEIDISNVEQSLDQFGKISEQIQQTTVDAQQLQNSIAEMAENPQQLLLGMTRLIGSKALEEGKSRLIATPIARTLVQKHLKRHDKDSAEAFCESVGIVPGTYWFETSYFNGIDFSHSTLFPYGSDEITIVANYSIKLLQLLPFKLEFHITQKAVTKAWMHGDSGMSGATAEEKVEILKEKGTSIWNSMSLNQRVSMIRSMGVDALLEEGYLGVSGETHIQAYDPVGKTFAMVASTNALYGKNSIDDVDWDDIRKDLKNWESQIKASTLGVQSIKVKSQDKNGNVTTKLESCSDATTKKVIIVIPEDEGLANIYEQLIKEMKSDVVFEVQPAYGKVFVDQPAQTEGSGS